MANTASARFQETDLSFSPGEIPAGITGVSVVMKRGPVNRPDILIRSWPECQKYYGGLQSDRDDALIVKMLLEGGTQLRINNIRNYSDITNSNSITATLATIRPTAGGYHVSWTGNPSAGHNYTLSATGYNTATVAFNVSALQTIKDLLAEFERLNPKRTLAGTHGAASSPNFYIAPLPNNTLAGLSFSGSGITGQTYTALSNFATSGGSNLFNIAPIAVGEEYNKLCVAILPPTNGLSSYFNLEAFLEVGNGVIENRELYENLKIDGPYTTANQTWLNNIIASSYILKPEYVDLSALAASSPAANLVPRYGIRVYYNGSDGAAVTATDYIGDSATRTGFYAFAIVDDCPQISVPNVSTISVHQAGAAYVNSRKDMVYFGHLDNGLTTENALISTRQGSNIDNNYVAFFAGGLKVVHPKTGLVTNISELASVLALAAVSEINFGAGKSFAGENRGVIQNALGVVNNFAYPGNYNGLNALANNQINIVGVRNNKVQIIGNFTAQTSNSLLSFLNVRRFIIELKRKLTPILGRYLEEPNLPAKWKMLYLEAVPIFEAYVKSQDLMPVSESYPGWRWEGDQFAANLDKLVINNKTDVLNGKYRILLGVTPTPSMQEILFDINLLGSTISFEEVVNNI